MLSKPARKQVYTQMKPVLRNLPRHKWTYTNLVYDIDFNKFPHKTTDNKTSQLQVKTPLKQNKLEPKNFSIFTCYRIKKINPLILDFIGDFPPKHPIQHNPSNCFDQIMKELTNIVKSSKMIKKLSISYNYYGPIEDKSFKFLCEALRKLTSLEDLNLNLKCCPLLKILALHSLRKTLETLSSLQRLELTLPIAASKRDSGGLEMIFKGLKRLASLRELVIDYESQFIENKSLEEISKTFKNFSLLKVLTLNFLHCPNLNDASFTILTKGLKRLSHLEIFTFKFGSSPPSGTKRDIPIEGILILLQFLENLKPLQSLTLDFMLMEAFDCPEVMQRFLCGLRKLNGLKKLSLGFRVDFVFDKDVCLLAQALTTFTLLEELTLSFFFFQSARISDQAKVDVHEMLKVLPNLKNNIKFNFEKAERPHHWECLGFELPVPASVPIPVHLDKLKNSRRR